MGQNTASLRTVALVGHGAAGKTTLAETLLAASGAITTAVQLKRATPSAISIRRKELARSLQFRQFAVSPGRDAQIHLLDTPGYPDFAGQTIGAQPPSIRRSSSLTRRPASQTSTERMMRFAAAQRLPHDRHQQDRRRQRRSA